MQRDETKKESTAEKVYRLRGDVPFNTLVRLQQEGLIVRRGKTHQEGYDMTEKGRRLARWYKDIFEEVQPIEVAMTPKED